MHELLDIVSETHYVVSQNEKVKLYSWETGEYDLPANSNLRCAPRQNFMLLRDTLYADGEVDRKSWVVTLRGTQAFRWLQLRQRIDDAQTNFVPVPTPKAAIH